jgi:hypothetical protein
MEPSPPRSPGPSLPPFGAPYTPRSQVDLGRLVGPPEGITPFMVAGLVRTPATKEQERGSPMGEPLTRGMTYLTISDRLATPYYRADLPSPTSDMTNPNSNGLGFGSPPRISPLGKPGHPPGDSVTHLNPNLTGRQPPRRRHRYASFGLDSAASPVLPLGTGRSRGVGVRQMAGRSPERHERRLWWVD